MKQSLERPLLLSDLLSTWRLKYAILGRVYQYCFAGTASKPGHRWEEAHALTIDNRLTFTIHGDRQTAEGTCLPPDASVHRCRREAWRWRRQRPRRPTDHTMVASELLKLLQVMTVLLGRLAGECMGVLRVDSLHGFRVDSLVSGEIQGSTRFAGNWWLFHHVVWLQSKLHQSCQKTKWNTQPFQ